MGRKRSWTDVQLREAVKHSRSWSETCRRLGLAAKSLNVKLHIERLRLSTAHWTRKGNGQKRTWTNEQLRKAVAVATSLTDTLRRLGLSHENSYSRSLVRVQIAELDLDYSHFVDWSHLRGLPLKKLLVRNSSAHASHLKERLLRRGMLKNECAMCRCGPVWRGRPLVLELDHKNGDRRDFRLSNLRLACPNCHSQTETYKGRNKRRYR